jgi:hypothetical protein
LRFIKALLQKKIVKVNCREDEAAEEKREAKGMRWGWLKREDCGVEIGHPRVNHKRMCK